MKKLISILLAITMVFSLFAMTASAEETTTEKPDGLTFDIIGKKEAEVWDAPGRYQIKVSVPGTKATDKYNEVIVMVDASTSQSGNFQNLKNLLIGLAEDILTEDSSIKLTLMGFGVGPRKAGSFYSVKQLETWLATATQEDLLQERSATNCEVGFEYVNEYINNSENLNKTFVIYTSDGAANMNESPRAWADWETFGDSAEIADYIMGVEKSYVLAGNDPLPYTTALFPDECVAVWQAKSEGIESEAYKAAVEALATVIKENHIEYVTSLLKSIHAYCGLTWGEAYSESDMEKAIQTYYLGHVGRDNESFDSFMNTYYLMACIDRSELSKTRAAEASLALQANEKVLGLFHVGYSGASNTWMNPEKGYYGDADISKLTYVYNTSFADVTVDMLKLTEQIVTMAYNDVTVTDPMSKWVVLDEGSIAIYDDATNTKLWDAENGWLTDLHLTDEDPISITTNADGHREITWKIKDGALLYTDRYSLRYLVDVNDKAEGFVYGTIYPANDTTTFTYIDEDKKEYTEEIVVPDVQKPEPKKDFVEGDTGIRIHKLAAETKAPISGIVFDIYKVELADGEAVSTIPTAEEIAKYAVEANLAATITTDVNGYAATILDEGIYLIVERENKEKVQQTVHPFYITLPYADPETGEVVDILDVYPKNVPVTPDKPGTPDSEIPEEGEEEVKGTFDIRKVDAANGTPLAGAEFQILRPAAEGETGAPYSYNGATVNLVPVLDAEGNPIFITTGENGAATSPELALGLYFLYETKAPAGYEVHTDVIPAYAITEGTEQTPVEITNIRAIDLPETGGIGTTIFYAVGGLLVLAAVVLLVTKKRMGAAN